MGKYIASKDNRIIKECSRLAQKKYRDKEGRYLIEGENLIREAVSNHVVIHDLLLREGSETEPYEKLDPYIIESRVFDAIAQTETSQGILAIVDKPGYTFSKLEEINTKSSNILVLDRLQDPGNIGTIIRTAEGAGYSAVIAIKGTADIYSPKVVRAAAGSVFRIPIVSVEDGRELQELVRKLGKKLAVTCLSNDRYYYDEELKEGIALVIGNEGGGCSQSLIDAADIKVMIPMMGKLESLNASVAAGILMYEAMRK